MQQVSSETQSITLLSPVPSSRRLIAVTDWNKHHDWPSIGGLRHLIFFADTNGFNRCLRRVGRRVLIDEHAFFEWVDKTNQ